MYYVFPCGRHSNSYQVYIDDCEFCWIYDITDLSIEKVTHSDLLLLIETGVDLCNIHRVNNVGSHFIFPSQINCFSYKNIIFGSVYFNDKKSEEQYSKILFERRCNQFKQVAQFMIEGNVYFLFWNNTGLICLNSFTVASVISEYVDHFVVQVYAIIKFFSWYVLILAVSRASNLYCLLAFDKFGRFVGAYSKSFEISLLCKNNEFYARMSVFYKED